MYALLTCLLATIPLGTWVGAAKAYSLQDMYQGQDFFNDWYFLTGKDPSGGNVNYLDMNTAQAQGLAYVDTDGTFVMAVDSTSNISPGGMRNSVRIQSNNAYTGGMFVLDAVQMPVGCGTWPAFWTDGPSWPLGGEIDIVEGTNNQPRNQMTVHSGQPNPCTLNLTAPGFTGHALRSTCHSTPRDNGGCYIIDSQTSSFGYGFNNAGGGVFVLEWDASVGLSIWHFERSEIPPDLANQNPTPANWGPPSGFWSASNCDITDNFYDHTMIINTSLCGWAASTFQRYGCQGTCSNVVANGNNFKDAFWRINYVAVYR